MAKKFLSLLKRKYIYGIILLFLFVAGFFILNNKKATEETITIRHSDFVNQISVSGKVVAEKDVNLGFKNSGLIKNVYFSVGQKVKANALIAQIDAKEAEKNVHDAEINLDSTKLALEKLKLQNSDVNMNANLQKAYDDGFVYVSDAFLDFPSTITGLDNLLNQTNVSDNTCRISGQTALDYKEMAVKSYYDAKNAFEKNRVNFRVLNRDSSKTEIEKIISETYNTTKILMDAIKNAKNLVDYLSEDTDRTSDYLSSQNTLNDYSSVINEHFLNLLAVQNSIKNYKDVFLDTSLDIQNSELDIKQKENTLRDAKNKLEDYYIRAPFDGIITKIDAKVGEMASFNVPLITIMSSGTFQIESYVPEVNIAHIKLRDEANITLDAYGENIFFKAKVIFIDPAETIRDGVSSYKTKFQFLEEDKRIKSGMTANISIITFSKPNVIVIPGGVVFDQAGKKFVQVKENEKTLEKEVVLGEVSSLGQIEVISGLSDGDIVLLNPKVK